MIGVQHVKALSVRQPWAWAILHAGKDVENRPERIARMAEKLIGQRIYIHAGLKLDESALDFMPDVDWPDEYDVGGIVGSAEVIGYHHAQQVALVWGSLGHIAGQAENGAVQRVPGSTRLLWS
jgi:hypothetical protein